MKKLLLFCIVLTILSCEREEVVFPSSCNLENNNNKINGGSILQTFLLPSISTFNLVQKTNANWVALCPKIAIKERGGNDFDSIYSFRVNDEIYKMRISLPKMKSNGLQNIMLKPSTIFWEINGSSFSGDFYVTSEAEWKQIETAYSELIYKFAKLSKEFPEVKLLCIGNELKEFTKRRPQFFRTLIARIRTDFPNLKLTYGANWDEYSTVSFWGDLDYIGISSYFPLVDKKTPTVSEVKEALIPIKNNLKSLSCLHNKPVLFTEYGYRSIDYAGWKSWLLGDITNENPNFEAQSNAYTAFYDTFWDESWVSGGFFWEWYLMYGNETNPNENGWYVNNKPVEKIIRERYAK